MTYYVTASDGTDIAYDCMGEGPPIVLIHGFGANRLITWANTNWYQTAYARRAQTHRHRLPRPWRVREAA